MASPSNSRISLDCNKSFTLYEVAQEGSDGGSPPLVAGTHERRVIRSYPSHPDPQALEYDPVSAIDMHINRSEFGENEYNASDEGGGYLA